MPEVPPQERDPESEAASAASSPFPTPRPEERPARGDDGLSERAGPFDQPTREGKETTAPSLLAWELSAGPRAEQPTPPPWRPTPPPERPAPASEGPPPPAGAPRPTDPTLPDTADVPYFAPSTAPQLPFGPATEIGTGGAGSAEAAMAAPPAERRSILRPIGRALREIGETVILALLIFLLVRAVVQNFQVEGRSMEPTLDSGWYLLVNKALYWEINLETLSKFIPFIDPGDDPTRYVFRGPRRGDVVVFKAPNQSADSPERDFIKRIIGLPGETVEVRDCQVFINGQPLDEPYIQDRPLYTYGPETVPLGHYFVLGDNRNNSSDSHSWGMLPKENIIGQAWLTYWPFSVLGLVDNTSVEPGEEEPAPAIGKPAAACS